jgi:hypothetical protein
MRSPCNPLVEVYTDVFYMIHKRYEYIPLVQCEVRNKSLYIDEFGRALLEFDALTFFHSYQK